MHIDWKSLGVVACVSIGAAVIIVAVVALGIASLATADSRAAGNQPAELRYPVGMVGRVIRGLLCVAAHRLGIGVRQCRTVGVVSLGCHS